MIGEMKTAVVGPGGQLYLTDGHHTLTSFWEVQGAARIPMYGLRSPGTCPT